MAAAEPVFVILSATVTIAASSQNREYRVVPGEQNFDVVILGGGSGGYAAALRSAELGKSVALIEKDKVGGTCLHRGCIPTKALLHAGEIADGARESAQFGVNATFEGIDMAGVHKYKDGVISKNWKGLQGLIRSRGITIVEGEGRLTGPKQVTVGSDVYNGSNVILATGSYSRTLPGLELDGRRVIASEHALTLDRVPETAIVLGGGVIGVEFASAWTSFGTEVTIIEALPHLVPLEDEANSKLLERAFRRRGIGFKLGARFARRASTPSPASGCRWRAARRWRPSCCWWRSAAARHRPTSATRRPASRWSAGSSPWTPTAVPRSTASTRSAT